jgi:hypothetical protein
MLSRSLISQAVERDMSVVAIIDGKPWYSTDVQEVSHESIR